MKSVKKGLTKTGEIILGVILTIIALALAAAMIISCLHGANILDYEVNEQILNTLTSSLLFLTMGGGVSALAIMFFKKARKTKCGASKKEVKSIENIYGKEVASINENYNDTYKQVIFKDGEKKLIKKVK